MSASAARQQVRHEKLQAAKGRDDSRQQSPEFLRRPVAQRRMRALAIVTRRYGPSDDPNSRYSKLRPLICCPALNLFAVSFPGQVKRQVCHLRFVSTKGSLGGVPPIKVRPNLCPPPA